MKLEFRVRGFAPKPGAAEYATRRIRFALDRFEHHLKRIRVHVTDVNGPRGGKDKRCQIVAEFHRGGEATVTETRGTVTMAIYFAVVRLRRQVANRLRGMREKARASIRHASIEPA
ncbi:MAG TPA: HPF/RaiA family ribosome-associated protein [Bryobacteraceae bacterium]|jgi:ribosome-associated translation inhibitor RaiA|nr:HPF/RaiA family ribosome-associated protein [Bryobacteraceae bacterium]